MTRDTYDAVVVSASISDSADDVQEIVAMTKAHNASLPVIIGGTILKQHTELAAMTGADVATNDIDEATSYFEVAK